MMLQSPPRAMVTSPHHLASEAGRDVLRGGGNAIEAAVTMGAVLSVTYPHFCGIGGDAVWMIADREGHTTCLLGIGQAINAANAVKRIETRGPGSVLTSAAAVDSWGAALDFSETYWDGKKSLASLLDPAIAYAEDGFPVTRSQLYWADFRSTETGSWPDFAEVFLKPLKTGRAGEVFRQPDLARTLRRIANDGPRAFYEGQLARDLVAGLAAAGALLDEDDLAQTRTREAKPLSLAYGNVTLFAPPPPTQGVTTLQIMGLLDRLGARRHEEGSPDFYHCAVEAVKQAFTDRAGLGDPAFSIQPVDDWLSEKNLAAKAAAIDPQKAMSWPHPFRHGDTVFFGATDAAGHSVSVLQSIYFDWGSGVVAGETGVLWQNRGAAFTLSEDHPNRLAPGKLPFYTLNPGLALKGGKPFLLYGTQGADGQPQTLSVLLSRLLDYQLSPEEALRRPRFLLGRTFSDPHDSLKIEADAGDEILVALAARGHEVAPIPAQSPLAGAAGVIRIAEDGSVTGAHDPRGDGCALGI